MPPSTLATYPAQYLPDLFSIVHFRRRRKVRLSQETHLLPNAMNDQRMSMHNHPWTVSTSPETSFRPARNLTARYRMYVSRRSTIAEDHNEWKRSTYSTGVLHLLEY